jgi:hypothetical protein
MQPSVGITGLGVVDGLWIPGRGRTRMLAGYHSIGYGGTAPDPGGVSLTMREIGRCICASGREGALAVGIPTERKRSPEARGRQDAEAPRIG